MEFSNLYFAGLRGTRSPMLLAPNDTVTLQSRGLFGKATTSKTAFLTVQEVFWENNDSMKWSAGEFLYKDPDQDVWRPRPGPAAIR